MLETAKGSSSAINPFEVALKQLDEAAKLYKARQGSTASFGQSKACSYSITAYKIG